MARTKLPTSIPSSTSSSPFHILPLLLPTPASLKVTGSSPPQEATHYLYVRPSQPPVPTPNDTRTLFLANLPLDATATSLRALFALVSGNANPRIETISLSYDRSPVAPSGHAPSHTTQSLPSPSTTTGKKRKRTAATTPLPLPDATLPPTWPSALSPPASTATITFLDAPSMHAALSLVRKRSQRSRRSPLLWPTTPGTLGSARYASHHQLRYPPPPQLLTSVDSFMTAFTAHEAQRAQVAKRARQEPDEDGFITVTRGGRTAPARQEDAQRRAEEGKQRDEARGLKDFYRFQSREERKRKAHELVEGMEQDRRKVAEMRMRGRGGFKPE